MKTVIMKNNIIIIWDSLTNDFAWSEERFLSNPVNVWKNTINRVFGSNENYWTWPLLDFLQSAQIAKKTWKLVETILVRDLHDPSNPYEKHELSRYWNHNITGTDWADFLKILEDVVKDTFVINTETLSIPTKIFHETMYQILQKDILSLTEKEREEIVFILCWFYTNIRIKNTAEKLRHDYKFPNVLVSPHLTWSRDHASHLHALQVDLPNSLIKVIADLPDIWEVAFWKEKLNENILSYTTKISPNNIADWLNKDQREIIKSLFLLNTEVELKLLSWWFSWSILFLARWEIDWNKTEPTVVKVDSHKQMYKEIFWYNLVKEYLGKNVPTFGIPISSWSLTWVKMELASMQGSPLSLQQYFEEAKNEDLFEKYLERLKSSLEILKNKLYKWKVSHKKLYPYREIWLHAKIQLTFLAENIGHIINLDNWKFTLSKKEIELQDFVDRFEKLTSNVDRIDWEVTLTHWDLNLANIISDNNKNIWIIDWTHAQESLIELDYAKIENDIKYVISKDFTQDDIEKFVIFENYILSKITLPDIALLPEEIKSLLDDLRFKKIYTTIKTIRDFYNETRTHSSDILYKIALLKYSTHTLSFNEARWRWECNKTQLQLALIWTHGLMEVLEKDIFHTSVPLHKAKNYPKRFVVPNEKKSWQVPFNEYNPPNYSNWDIQEKDIDYSWISIFKKIQLDTNSRPLNPAWRTWIAWRWDLYYRWPNLVVDPVIVRKNSYNWKIEILLVKRKNTNMWEIPWTFLFSDEKISDAIIRWIKEKVWFEIENLEYDITEQIYMHDSRNTDNAWIESQWVVIFTDKHINTANLNYIWDTDYAEWIDIESNILQHLFINHIELINKALQKLVTKKILNNFDENKIKELQL